MKPTLIGLCSPAMGSGKTTVARYLVQRHGFFHVAFAAPLKRMTAALFAASGMPPAEIDQRVYHDLKEDVMPLFGLSSRQIQQKIGTEFGRREIHPDIWVDIAMAAAQAQLDRGKSVVIDDMRFLNELHAVQRLGGRALRIVRPGAAVTVAHVSEGQLDDIDIEELQNNGSVAQLHLRVDMYMNHLKRD